MSLEGRLRDLALQEVCQLLAQGRKTGTLHVRAPLLGQRAAIVLRNGMLVDVWIDTLDDDAPAPAAVRRASGRREAMATVTELLAWTDGDFHFDAATANGSGTATPVEFELALDQLLVEAMDRAEVWGRIRHLVPNARAVPTFVSGDAHELPMLKLSPDEWETLTRVDGERDVEALAAVMKRDDIDVATIVHRLIEAGLLEIVARARPTTGAAAARRANAPVPTIGAMENEEYWTPGDELDSLFDPLTDATRTIRDSRAGSSIGDGAASPFAVAQLGSGPSLERERAIAECDVIDAAQLCRDGDAAARRGELAQAVRRWSESLAWQRHGQSLPAVQADRVHEAIAVAERLRALIAAA